MKYVFALSEAHERETAGGKAASLAFLLGAGLPVPDGFVITEAAFAASCQGAGPELPERVSAEVERQIIAALAVLSPHGEPVAVRSSGLHEDGPRCSFAGQFDSFLCVPPQRVAQRVAEVWRSGFSERVRAYRAQMGVSGPARAPAVLVQRMVDADAAGIAFSVDPAGGSREVALVHAVPGLALGLVNGDCDGDSYHIDRQGRVTTHLAADSTHGWRAGADGVQRFALGAEPARRPALAHHQASEVAALARRCEQLAGSAQDIEWALVRGRLWLLQSRPITGLAALTEAVIWDNSNIAESYGGVTTPLTFSYIRRNYAFAYRSLCRLAGVGEAQIAAHDDCFARMLGLLRGRVYYNLTSWYRLLALIPGFRFNRRLLDQMLGVQDRAAQPQAQPMPLRLADSVRIVVTIACHYFTLPWRVRRFEQRLVAALVPPCPPLAERDAAQLVAYQRDLDRRLLTRWDAPLVNDFFLMVFHGALKRLVDSWLAAAPGGLDNRLLCGDSGIVSVEPAQRITALAALAEGDPQLVERLCNASAAEAQAHLPPVFAASLRDYLARFGERCHHELKLESRTLHDDPLPLLRSIGALARKPASDPVPVAPTNSVRALAQQQVAAALSGRPLRRALFGWVLANTRALLGGRESLRLARTRAFARARCILLELGQRLCAAAVLDAAEDVFWLELDELFGFVEGTSTTLDLRALTALRRAEFAQYQATAAPPDRLETRGAVHLASLPDSADEAAPVGDAELRTGQGCGPGQARGRARVVLDPASARIEAGVVLVAERTDPGWVMLFPLASALVVERGSLLSHAAIVAREMGLPAVVGLRGACRWLADGDAVEVDGAQGTVRRCALAQESRA